MTTSESVRTLFDEDFARGLALGGRWRYVEAPGFVSDDGSVTATATGVSIAPAARNPTTGDPMFTKDADGFAGHLKWMVFTAEAFPTGDGPLRIRFRAGARCFGLDRQPYGSAVQDPDADIRLGSATLNVLDFESGLVFDFWMNNAVIVPFYERLRPPGFPQDYQAFGSVGTPIPREPGSVHDLAIVVDAANGTVYWEIDGTVVASVDRLGPPAEGWTTVLDHGGSPEVATPRQIQVGIGLLTLLDASLPPSPDALVSIGADLQQPTRFSATGPTLFGQGVQLDIERITVEPA